MPRDYQELTGCFDYEKNVFGVADDRTVIAVLECGTVVKGRAREGELQTGITYLFRGYWTDHPKYGKQFRFHSFGVSQPVGQRGTVSYLTRGPHIGRKRAMQIWELYGQDSLEVIRERPEEVAAKVSGLTEERTREAATYFKAHKDREIVERDLAELLGNGGFPRRLPEKLIEVWGAKAAERIRVNAYCLMRFSGVGHSKADKLYLNLGGNPDSPERLGWAAWNALHKDREGSTWKPLEFGTQAILKDIGGTDTPPAVGIQWGLESGNIVGRVDAAGRKWIAERERAEAESRLANQVYRAMVEGEAS
jgi:exodeoxyribonuclease V alpha subunit